jgi:hypothetical protein
VRQARYHIRPAPPKLVPFEAATPSIMGILDDAIREHLDLKRKHGARDSELRELEDEALGSGEQSDPFTAGELFNESSAAEAPPAEGAVPGPATPPPGLDQPSVPPEDPTRIVEAESPLAGEPESALTDEPLSPPEGLRQVPGQEQFEEPIPGQQRLDEPSGAGAPPPDPSLPEVEPPAPSESLEELIGEEEPFPEDTAAPPPSEDVVAPPEDTAAPPPPPPPPPVEEAPVENATPEPESAAPDPPPPPPEPGSEPPGRARGRIDVPTQEHPPPGETGGLPPLPDYEDEHDVAVPADEAPPVVEPPSVEEPLPPDEPETSSSGPALYDFETDEDLLESPPPAPADTDDDFEALGPETDERPYVAPETDESPYIPEEEPSRDEPPRSSEAELKDDEVYGGDSLEAEESFEQKSDTDDDLWFEKGPPKDFDFEDD